jgi:hypothetical protein
VAVTRTPVRLFHYTCNDAYPLIVADGCLKPNRHPFLPEPLVWLTDLDEPEKLALGLDSTGVFTTCDRTGHRLTVQPGEFGKCIWWPLYARRLDRALRDAFESHGALPVHWWVALEPIGVVT